MAKVGGVRKGAGRPPGSKNKEVSLRKRITEFFNDEEIRDLVNLAKEQAKEKPELLKFILEQIFGKAPQRVELTGEGEGPLHISWE